MHFEIADTFRAEGYEVSGMDIRDAIDAYKEAKAEEERMNQERQREQEREARARAALAGLSASLHSTVA
ncbi:hypothetical protein [Azospirillum sp. sgz302134]